MWAMPPTGPARTVTRPVTALADAARSAHKRSANDLIYESLGEQFAQPIAFFCECPSDRCFDTVWLSAEEYAAGRRGSDWAVLAPLH
jgi:hypothetical protein